MNPESYQYLTLIIDCVCRTPLGQWVKEPDYYALTLFDKYKITMPYHGIRKEGNVVNSNDFHINGYSFLLSEIDYRKLYDLYARLCNYQREEMARLKENMVKAFASEIEMKNRQK
jgi:hypothetical protein